ncbi:hypothetical protein COOONC_10199 [Cooperia oncophora]
MSEPSRSFTCLEKQRLRLPDRHKPSGAYGGLPPGFEEVLPSDVVKQLKMIDENDALTGEQKRQKTDEVFSSLPTEIIDKLPHPPFFEHLPKEMQKAINQIRRNRITLLAVKNSMINEKI